MTKFVFEFENPRIAIPNSSGNGEAMMIPAIAYASQRNRGIRK